MVERDERTRRRVVVLGTTGAGKVHPRRPASCTELLGTEHIELDAFNHGPNWTPRPPEEFAAGVAGVLERPSWVVDGNYIDRVSTTLWPRAEVVVWLDLPLWVILPRLVRRTIQRVRRRVDLWGGNRERWSALFGRDSLLWWAVRSQRRHRAELPGRLTELERSGVRTVWLTSGRAADRWLAEQAAVDSR